MVQQNSGRRVMVAELETETIGFLLVDNFTLLAFSSAVEVLRMANLVADRQIYRWQLFSRDGQPARSSCGLSLAVDGAAHNTGALDMLFVVGGTFVHRAADSQTIATLRKLGERRMVLGALCTGSYLLAKADLLDGYRCTIHWENMASIREEFPNLLVSQEQFEIDRDRLTCAGGISPLRMMLHLVHNRAGDALAAAISEVFMFDAAKNKSERQRVPLMQRIGAHQPKLAEAVSLMEANVEEPMTLDELSVHVGLSRRQLERLFKKYLNCVPTRYYLEVRLERARQLLLQTSMPIVDIALACGFISAPHFSKCYRDVYKIPPRDERRRVTTQ